MTLFNAADFERQCNSDTDALLNSNEEIQKAIIKLSENALKNIKIFTPDLERALYDNDLFRAHLIHFIQGNRHAQVQILATDISLALQQGHQLLRLAQNLTTAIKIKIIPEEYSDINCSFVLVDQTHFIFKRACSQQTAIQADSKIRANKLLEFFDPAWEHGKLALESKQIFI